MLLLLVVEVWVGSGVSEEVPKMAMKLDMEDSPDRHRPNTQPTSTPRHIAANAAGNIEVFLIFFGKGLAWWGWR